MALRFIDSFDHYASADFAKKWTSLTPLSGINSSGGRNGTGALRAGNTNGTAVKSGLGNQATWILGAAFKFVLGNSFTGILAVRDAGTIQCDVRITTDGELKVTRNGTQLAVTSGLGLSGGAWYFIEFKTTIHNTAGSYEVRLNGSSIAALTASGVNTRASANNYGNEISICLPVIDSVADDLYVCDGSGSVNNNFLGDRRVVCIRPDGAGNSAQWTPSAGANYQCVDEAEMNNDTDYVSSATAGQIDLYAFGAVGVSGDVAGIQTVITARKDDAGSRSLREKTRVSSTNYDGDTESMSDSYLMYRKIRETNPNTSAAWTVAGINGAEFGVELIS